MTGSGAFYESSTFWAGASVAVAVTGISVAIVLWLRGSPRRLLVYNLDADTALLSSDARKRAGSDLQVVLGGQVVDNPHIVSFRIESRSRRDIRPEDFIGAAPLSFDMGTPILKLVHRDTGGEAMPDVLISVDGSKIVVAPSLVKSKQAIRLDLLTDGVVSVTCPRPALADVIVRERTYENIESPWLKQLRYSVYVTFLVGMGGSIVSHEILKSQSLTAGFGLLVFLPLLAFMLAAASVGIFRAYQVGWMRGPESMNVQEESNASEGSAATGPSPSSR